MTSKPKVFVSYTKSDEGVVHQIVSDIEEHGFETWFAPDEMTGGDRLSMVSSKIDQSDYVLVMLSQSSVNSRWVQHEMNTAIALHLDGKHLKVVPVLLESISRPAAIADLMSVDFSQGEYKKSFQRLLAVLKGKPLGDEDPFRQFQLYVEGLVRLDSDAFSTVDNEDFWRRLGRSGNRYDRRLIDQARRRIEEQLVKAGVSDGNTQRILQEFDGGWPLSVVSEEQFREARDWLRSYGHQELVQLAAELWRGVRNGLRGITARGLEAFIEELGTGQPGDPAKLTWHAGRLASTAMKAGLLARSTEYNHPKTHAYQDAQINPSFDMGPMVRTIGKIADAFEETAKGRPTA